MEERGKSGRDGLRGAVGGGGDSEWSKPRSGWSSVTPSKLQRQADEFVRAGGDVRKVQSLYNDHLGSEKNLMRLRPIRVVLNREVIDAETADAVVDHPLRGIRGESHIVLLERAWM
jgi:hypothetical protein